MEVTHVEETKKMIDAIGEVLISKHSSIAIAESVTSGNLQAVFSLAKDAASFFQGGITVYNLGQKCRHLNIDPIHVVDCNCVSNQVALTPRFFGVNFWRKKLAMIYPFIRQPYKNLFFNLK